MNKEELEANLQELDEALAEAFPGPEPMNCLVVGGACLLLAGVSVRPTSDIDVIVTDLFGEGNASLIYNLDKTTKKVRKIIKDVGKRLGLPRDKQVFLNDDCAIFLLEVGDIPEMEIVRAYKKLHLSIPKDLGYILACKLMASRPEKDYADIKVLCELLHIHTRGQAQRLVNRFVPNFYHQYMNDVPRNLAVLFPEP